MAGDNHSREKWQLLPDQVMAEDGADVRVRCTDCSFERTVSAEADVKPAEVLIEHGQRTGHKLTIDRIGDYDE